MMRVSPAGQWSIKRLEGCKLKAYRDGGGVLTIGYGHTGAEVKAGTVWLQIQANYTFEHDLQRVEDGVNRLVKVELSQSQFDALCSFAYNVGLDEDEDTKAEGLGDSTLLRLLNTGDYIGAAKEFLKWDHDGGKVVEGLTRRRKAEHDLFLKGVQIK